MFPLTRATHFGLLLFFEPQPYPCVAPEPLPFRGLQVPTGQSADSGLVTERRERKYGTFGATFGLHFAARDVRTWTF